MKRYQIRTCLVGLLAFTAAFWGCSKDNTYIYVDAATLSLSQYEQVLFTPEGGTVEISVTTNQEAWSVVSDQKWCEVTPLEGKFQITVAESASAQPQPAAKVTITAGPEFNQAIETLTVTQTAMTAATLTLDPAESIAFAATGGSRKISVTTNQATWSVESGQSWCTVVKGADGFTVSVTENSTAQSRPEAELIVKAGPEKNQAVATLRVHQEGKPVFNGTNLSEKGTANCYLVTASGDYIFSATMMGNNAATPGISPSGLAPASAELLWQDYYANGEGLIREVSLNDGFVTFSTYATYHRGNAVIAVKNAAGAIIWSWHLWFSDDVKNLDVADLTNNKKLLYTVQDRNLGAISATPGNNRALGLYYQWGRKDPFLSSAGKGYPERTMEPTAFVGSSVTTQAASAYTYDIDGQVNNSESKMVWKSGAEATDLATAIANPTTFYPYTRGLKPMTYDWLAMPNPALWGNPWEGGAIYPTYSEKKCNSGKGSKSIYDPCPVGYRVIPMDTWVRAGVKNGSNQLTYDGQNYGYKFNILISGESLWFPLAGNRDQSDGRLASSGSAGFCWTSSPFAGDGESQYMNSATVSCSSMVFTNQAGINRAWGYPVRCCKE